MLAGCVFCIALPEIRAKIAGALGLLFFGFSLYAITRAFFRTRIPKIVIDQIGIHSGSSFGLVEWADVKQLRVDAIKGTKFVSIFVTTPEKYLARMNQLARKSAELQTHMGFSELTISFVGLSPGLDEALYYLKENGIEVSKS